MKGTDDKVEQAREEALEELFRHAEPRERPPPAAERTIRDSLHGQWAAITQRRKTKRRGLFAVAATVAVAALAAAVLFDRPQPTPPGVHVAEVVLARGHSSVLSQDGGPGVRITVKTSLEAGQEVRTAPGGGLALGWFNGITLRLDEQSRVLLLDQDRARLLSGRIYIDTSDALGAATGFRILTPAGPVRHVGTRYMVGVLAGATSVSVRDGQVLLGEESAGNGERLTVTVSGERNRETIEAYGEEWSWTEDLAMPMETDGRTVAELLTWIGRETGRSVEYASREARTLALETRIHGNIAAEPMKALDLVMETTDLEAEIRGGTIRILAEQIP